MRRKRLNHSANQFWQQFLGWQLMWCYGDLVNFGDGILEIDVLNSKAMKDAMYVPNFLMVKVLHGWFLEELERFSIPICYIKEAFLKVRLQLSLAPWLDEILAGEMFAKNGKPVITDRIQVCHFSVIAVIRTDETVYEKAFSDTKAWPEGWSAG